MKIHIVQKGDTLWNLAQKYGVDFEELLKANSHLANPDLIMPGMKIKIPTSAVPAKKDTAKEKVVAPKQAVKKEVKEIKKEVPKLELEPAQAVEDDVSKLKELLKKAAPHVIKKLLVEHKPEVVQQIKIEIINQQEQKMTQPAPLPKMEPYIPPKPMPMPQMAAPQAMSDCSPVKPMHWGKAMYPCPTCSGKQGMSKAGSMPAHQAWGMGSTGQSPTVMPYYGSGYGLMPFGYPSMGAYPGYPGSFTPMMGGYQPSVQQGMGPLGNYGYYGQSMGPSSYQREAEEEEEAKEN